jgi:hypothetical protein
MVRNQQYKLVQQAGLRGYGRKMPEDEFVYELFDMTSSAVETENIAEKHPDIVQQMKKAYEQWYNEVGKDHDYSWPPFYIGSPNENPMYLYQYAGIWPNAKVITHGKYNIKAIIPNRPPAKDMIGHFIFRKTHATVKVKAGATQYEFKNIRLDKGEGVLQVHLGEGGTLELWPEGVRIECLELK